MSVLGAPLNVDDALHVAALGLHLEIDYDTGEGPVPPFVENRGSRIHEFLLPRCEVNAHVSYVANFANIDVRQWHVYRMHVVGLVSDSY